MSLPNLLVAGVPKAGTGSLFAYLAQHPDVCPSTKKEIRFFAPDAPGGRSRPVEWYERFFAHRAGERFALEATPSYCYMGPTVIEAVGTTLDRPRIVMILRDPVDRLWSAFTFQRSLGHLPVGVDAFQPYVEACLTERAAHPRVVDQGDFKGVSIGMYGEFLPAWDAAFGEDLVVVWFDDLVRDPRAVLRRLCGWLAIDDAPVDAFSLEARNPTVHPRSVALARRAAAARTWSKRVLRRAPGVRRRLRDAYLKANAGPALERPDAATTAQLRSLYDPSNHAVTEMLARRGDHDVPAWLGSAQTSDADPG